MLKQGVQKLKSDIGASMLKNIDLQATLTNLTEQVQRLEEDMR